MTRNKQCDAWPKMTLFFIDFHIVCETFSESVNMAIHIEWVHTFGLDKDYTSDCINITLVTAKAKYNPK